MLKYLCAIVVAAIVVPSAAPAASLNLGSGNFGVQLPPPFGMPGPVTPGQCSPQYQKLLKLQIDALRRLQQLVRGEGEKLCATLEGADQLGVAKLIDPKSLQQLLTRQQREFLEALGVDVSKVDVARLMRLLGIDLSKIDLRHLKEQCRQSQGSLDRFVTAELGKLGNETIRCDDRV